MSIRITSRSRPRLSGYPWPLRTSSAAVAALRATSDKGVSNLIGPLPMRAVMQMIYRVRAWEYEASATIDVGGSPESDSAFVAAEYASTINEVDIFRAARVNPSALFEGATTPEMSDEMTRILANDVREFWDYDAEVFEDENGMFWVAGVFETAIVFDSAVVSIGTQDTGGTARLVTASLEFSASEKYDIDAIALTFDSGEISAAALTIKATAWWPYATEDGSAAWNTTTGAPANGGPGA